MVFILILIPIAQVFSQNFTDNSPPREEPLGIEVGLPLEYFAFLGLGLNIAKQYYIGEHLSMSTGLFTAYGLKIPQVIGVIVWDNLDDKINWDGSVGLEQRLYVFDKLPVGNFYVGVFGGYMWWSVDGIPAQKAENVFLGASAGYMLKFARILFVDPRILVFSNIPTKTFADDSARIRYITALPNIVFGVHF